MVTWLLFQDRGPGYTEVKIDAQQQLLCAKIMRQEKYFKQVLWINYHGLSDVGKG